MKHPFSLAGAFLLGMAFQLMPVVHAQDAPAAPTSVAALDQALNEAKEGASEARKRLAVRRVIRDAETMLETMKDKPERYPVLEFVFRARKELIALDDDPEHRKALLDTCRELVKAPDEMAAMRVEADLLLSQAELARQGGDTEARAKSLMPFVARYIDTPEGARVLRMAMVMALELGDNRVVTDLQEMIEEHYAADLEMIAFQRDKLGGQVFGAPFTGVFENSKGKTFRYPMDTLGRSTVFFFWSNQDSGAEVMKGVAKGYLENKKEFEGRLEIVSFNLDELPDAGESVVRGLGLDWEVLRLPGGRENAIYEAYVRSDPKLLTVSPTGYTALIMSGTTRIKTDSQGEIDYGGMFQSSLTRQWTKTRYVEQLSSLIAGDFLVIDPQGGIDPTMPPEMKALASAPKPLERSADSVPEETLKAIQACFIAPPMRYRATHEEMRANYSKAAELSRKAIADHPNAPDLWIVRNRLIISLLGLWKTDTDLAKLEEAITEAKSALSAGFPAGCEIIARFCIAREDLRKSATDTPAIIRKMVEDSGGATASGQVLATAAILSLEVADRKNYENYSRVILKDHTENPMMWIFSSFLLDRYHRYWLFQVPFTAGWSYGRREGYFMSDGKSEEAHRILKTELVSADGKPMRIPEDLSSEYTLICFVNPPPWKKSKGDGLPESPERMLKPIIDFAAARPNQDVKVIAASFGGKADVIQAELLASRSKVECPAVSIPGGIANPLVHRLGILSEDEDFNSVLLDKNGRILTAISGLATNKNGSTLINVVSFRDENHVNVLLEKGEVDAAKQFILALAPPFDPEAVDAKGRKITKKPEIRLPHLRARARVYLALGEMDKALADAQEVVQRQLSTDGGMSLRTDELDDSEALRDLIKEKMDGRKK